MSEERDNAPGGEPTHPPARLTLRIQATAPTRLPRSASAREFYLIRGEEQTGPFSEEVIVSMLRSGEASPTDLCLLEGQAEWLPLAELFPHVCPATDVTDRPTGSGTAAVPPDDDRFAERLLGVLAYPFQGDGLIVMAAGVVFFLALGFLSRFAGLISVILGLFSVGYLFGALQAVVQSSAQGEDELPRWPDFTGWSSEIVQPFLLWLATLVVCFGPALAVGYWGGQSGDTAIRGAAIALGFAGLIYYPMALLAVAMADSLAGLHPGLVIRSIAAVPGRYAATVVVLVLILALQFGGAALVELTSARFGGDLWKGISSLYFAIVQARLLGVLYHASKDRLGWF